MPNTKKWLPGEEKIEEAMSAFFAQQTDSLFLTILGEQEYRLSLLELGLA